MTARKGIFSRIFNVFSPKNQQSWLPSDDRWYSLSLPRKTNSGANVDEYTSLQYSAVFCAINLIAGTIGTLPLFLYRKTKDGKVKAEKHPLYNILHQKPNEYMTAVGAREAMAGHLISWGNCFAEKTVNFQGQVTELFPIPPNRVRIEIDKGIPTYMVTVGSKEIPMSRDKILHTPGMGFDGFQGYSVLGIARESIGLGIATEEFGSKFFGSGTHPSAIIKHPAKLSEGAYKNLKESLATANEGLGNAHKAMILEEGMDLAKVGIPPNDAQFLETRRFQVEDIARWFNLPVHKLKEMTKSSFNNIEAEQISFVTDSIRPWLVRLEQNYNTQLLTESEIRRGYFFEHSVEGLLRGDAEARSNLYKAMFNVGAMSINEIRSHENMNAVEGGDERFVPMNMVPLSMAKQLAEKQSEPKQIPNEPTGSGGDPNASVDLMPFMKNVATRVVNREGIMLFRIIDRDGLDKFYDTFSSYVYEQLEPFWDAIGVKDESLSDLAEEYAESSRDMFGKLIGESEYVIDKFVAERIPAVTDLFYKQIVGGEDETEI